MADPLDAYSQFLMNLLRGLGVSPTMPGNTDAAPLPGRDLAVAAGVLDVPQPGLFDPAGRLAYPNRVEDIISDHRIESLTPEQRQAAEKVQAQAVPEFSVKMDYPKFMAEARRSTNVEDVRNQAPLDAWLSQNLDLSTRTDGAKPYFAVPPAATSADIQPPASVMSGARFSPFPDPRLPPTIVSPPAPNLGPGTTVPATTGLPQYPVVKKDITIRQPAAPAVPKAPVLPAQVPGVAGDYTRPTPEQKGIPVAVRMNNPGNQWMSPIARRFGATTSANVSARDQPAIFPDRVSGAAAQFALLGSKNYINKPLNKIVERWSAGTDPSYVNYIQKTTGIAPNTIITRDFLASPKGIELAKSMAQYEAGYQKGAYPLSEAGWGQAQRLAFGPAPAPAQPSVAAPATPPAAPVSGPTLANVPTAPALVVPTPTGMEWPTPQVAPAAPTPPAAPVSTAEAFPTLMPPSEPLSPAATPAPTLPPIPTASVAPPPSEMSVQAGILDIPKEPAPSPAVTAWLEGTDTTPPAVTAPVASLVPPPPPQTFNTAMAPQAVPPAPALLPPPPMAPAPMAPAPAAPGGTMLSAPAAPTNFLGGLGKVLGGFATAMTPPKTSTPQMPQLPPSFFEFPTVAQSTIPTFDALFAEQQQGFNKMLDPKGLFLGLS